MTHAREFAPVQGRPEPILDTYGPSLIGVSYLCDNYHAPQGAKIVGCDSLDGRGAQEFIRHCLNNLGLMADSPWQAHYESLADIPFEASESTELGGGYRRIINLLTGAEHPEIPWREFYNIFVFEKHPQRYPAFSELGLV